MTRIAERFPGYFRRKAERGQQAAQERAAEKLQEAQERLHDFADGDNTATDSKRRGAVFIEAAKQAGAFTSPRLLQQITTQLQIRDWGRDDGVEDGGKALRVMDRRQEAWDRRNDFLSTLFPEDTPQIVYDGLILAIAIDAALRGYEAVPGFRALMREYYPNEIRPHPSSAHLWHLQTREMAKMERAAVTLSHFPGMAIIAFCLLTTYGDVVRAERHLAGETPAMVRYSHLMPPTPLDEGEELNRRVLNAYRTVGDVNAVGEGFERQRTVRRFLSSVGVAPETQRGFDRYAA